MIDLNLWILLLLIFLLTLSSSVTYCTCRARLSLSIMHNLHRIIYYRQCVDCSLLDTLLAISKWGSSTSDNIIFSFQVEKKLLGESHDI